MDTKEKLIKEIDSLPDDIIEEVYQYLLQAKTKKPNKKLLKTYSLKGRFDKSDIRSQAYE